MKTKRLVSTLVALNTTVESMTSKKLARKSPRKHEKPLTTSEKLPPTTSPYFSQPPPPLQFKKTTAIVQQKSAKGAVASKAKRIKKKRPVQRTMSFSPIWDATVRPTTTPPVQPHTLILGTHPSIASLSEQQYYGHVMNAFWWIAGDCLGFRRGSGVSPQSNKPYQFTSHLRHDKICSYQEQLAIMTKHGFCMWDTIGSCHRPGSLDQDITKGVPNDIQGFCAQHPSIRRIVLANGGTGAEWFIRYNKEWLKSGALTCNQDERSEKAFKKCLSSKGVPTPSKDAIILVAPLPVSPAAARYSYPEKRDYWEQHVYQPGLALLNEWKHQQGSTTG